MKIKMRRLAAGPQGVMHAGAVAEVPNDFARQLVSQGYAVECQPEYQKPVERTGQPLGRAISEKDKRK